MCCRTRIYPLDLETAISVLTIGRFRPVYWPAGGPGLSAGSGQAPAITWDRAIDEEGAAVIASLNQDALELSLSPAVSTFADHFGKRITAGVYFEIAAKYAEKVRGEIVQRATVAGCRDGKTSQELLVARYPAVPMDFTRICAGFRAAILGDAEAA